MQIGVVGKTNTGKSTFFSAATMVAAEIGNRPFVTIKPNQGTAYVTAPCVHVQMGKQCMPQNSRCEAGVRLIPITLLDVAGLIEGAWQGKGLGNMFLNDLMQASALVHVLDCSGTTDAEGNPAKGYDPAKDVLFLEKEIDYWIRGILQKNWAKISKTAAASEKPWEALAQPLSGLGMSEADVKSVFEKGSFSGKPSQWSEEEQLDFAEMVRGQSKPMLIACNKMDLPGAKENLGRLQKQFPEKIFVPCCAEAELTLRKAAKAGLIEYTPGAKEFKVLGNLDERQRHALEFIQTHVLDAFGSTGVQQAINRTAFELLKLILVYPVEDQHKLVDSKGNVLPSAYLLRQGATALDLAAKVHSSFAERFVAAIDCKTGQKIGKEHALRDNDVVKIQLHN
ncbi:MAG: redox-regulated ATPase YchF [Candidatus Diapherotrites archaeon]|nr:redox-regulated ATPase YchF [Candidatus Diapherotrites archaeon]